MVAVRGTLARRAFFHVRLRRRRWCRLLREIGGKVLHVAVAQVRGEWGHLRVAAPLFAELQQLVIDIKRRLGGERWHRWRGRIAAGPVTGDADFRFTLARRGICGGCRRRRARRPDQPDAEYAAPDEGLRNWFRHSYSRPMRTTPPAALRGGGFTMTIVSAYRRCGIWPPRCHPIPATPRRASPAHQRDGPRTHHPAASPRRTPPAS